MSSANESLMRAVGAVMRDHLGRIGERLRGIDARLDAMQANLADAWVGTHKDGNSYKRGQLVTHSGGLWLALRDTSDRPGTSDALKLIVKRGGTP
jgi:hypothetical protein